MPRQLVGIIIIVCLQLTTGCTDEQPGFTPDLVDTASGPVQGFSQEEALSFLGIPFAAPPVAELRWRPPQTVQSWTEPLLADHFSAACPQPEDSTPDEDATAFGQEDCLYLNVWSPADRGEDERLPVLVFLHGGGNFLGSTAEPLSSVLDLSNSKSIYDGARLSARERVVVVTTNYRLGALGFITHPLLEQDSDSGASGNYGLMDQIFALQWVGENIAGFGGDPARVLLFGQSGGARDVCLLMTSPQAVGLFSRAAFHSGPCGAQDDESASQHSQALFGEMGCDDTPDPLACMRAIDDPYRLVLAQASLPDGLASGAFRPTVDGHVILGQPRDVFGAGDHNHVPFLLGTNALEYAHRWQGMTEQQYSAAVTRMYGAQLGQQVLDHYPVADYGAADRAYQTMMSDRNVTCTIRRLATTVSANQDEPVFLYRFHQVLSAPERLGEGAYHTSELLYLYQHMDGQAFQATHDERLVERAMARYWAAFADQASPDTADLAAWPKFESSTNQHMNLQPVPESGQDLKKDLCDFWDSLIP